LLAARGDWRRWSGTLFADLPWADFGELHRHLSLPFELGDGEGALRAWVDVEHGEPDKATLDFALRAVSMHLPHAADHLVFEQLQGRLDAERDADGVRLHMRRLGFRTDDGLSWPAGALSLAWRQKQDPSSLQPSTQPVTGGELIGEQLDLDTLARAASRLPLGEAAQGWLQQLAPRGTLRRVKASWDGPWDAPKKYQVSASLDGLSLQAASSPEGPQHPSPGRPGVRNASLQFDADERGGKAQLSIKPGTLTFPGVWEQPEIAFDELDAAMSWRVTPLAGRAPRIEVTVDPVHIGNADVAGEFRAGWRSGDADGGGRDGRFPGHLDLSGKLQRARAESVARYLPLHIAPAAREYVQRSIRGGRITSASFRVNGELREFPFHASRDGELRIALQLQDVTYDYLPSHPGSGQLPRWDSPWPGFDRVSGELRFDRLAMSFRGVQGRLWGYELRDVQGGIDDLSDRRAVLKVEGRGRGPAADLLRFVRATPVASWIGPVIEPVSASGPSDLDLALRLPFGEPAQASLRGSVQLYGGELRVHPDLPVLQAARGAIDFTPRGFSLRDASARVLGGDVNFDGGLGADGALRIGAQGVATAEALRSTPQIAGLAQAASLLRGQAAYRATLARVRGQSELTVSSNLVGLQIDLPAPLAKAAPAAWPTRFQIAPMADMSAAGAPPRDQLSVDIADVFKAQYQRELSGASAKVLRGSLAVLDTLPPPAAGVQASLNLGRLDVDAWQAVLDRLDNAGGADSADGATLTAAASGYLPQSISMRADELRSGSRMLSRVVATVQRGPQDPVWRATVQADQLEGRLEYRPPKPPAQAGGVMARLQRLALPHTEVGSVENLLAQPPPSMPALDIVVDDFELRGRKLGRVEVQAVNRLAGRAGQREWQLDKLNLTTPEAQLTASGRWSAVGARRMALDFKLDLADSGAFIERLGAGHALRGGKGRMQGQLSWAGSPLTLDYPSMEGRVRLDVDAGQFLHGDPGAARLLGVLSLQSLPRRLSLDFRDLFQEGFAFDSISGDVTVARGTADTRNLIMRGAQATVLMQGSADLLRETQDLHVLIVPNIDAGGAALATMAINPAIGLGTLFAQWVLREPLRAAGTREFEITGGWAEPKVHAVERAVGAPAPVIEAPPAVPGSGAAAPDEPRLPG
jgi:uncharacterized protein (TIGR02099 family)